MSISTTIRTSQSKILMFLWGYLLIASQVISTDAFLPSAPPSVVISSSSSSSSSTNISPRFSSTADASDFFFPVPAQEYSMDPLSLSSVHGDSSDASSTTTAERPSRFSKIRSFFQAYRTKQRETQNKTKKQRQQEQLKKQNDDDNESIQCYIVNYDAVQDEGATPEVMCTSNTKEFAWYHGLEVDDLVNTNELPSLEVDFDFNECVEGASHRGTPEWECKVHDQDQKDQVDNDDEENNNEWKNFGI